MKRFYPLLLILLFSGSSMFAINPDSLSVKQILKSNEQTFATIYSNFHSSISEGNNPSGMEITRAYLGYKKHLSKNVYAKVNLDIGSPNDESQYALLRRFAYFKNAYVAYEDERLTANFGIIGLHQFKIQENFWGHRYIYKNVIDEHKLGYSADIGASISYKFLKWLSADFTFMNGEGYTHLQTDNTYKVGLGVTLKPVKGLILRIYGDYEEKDVSYYSLTGFVGYRFTKNIKAGFEYNQTENYRYLKDHQREAWSAYFSWDFWKHFQLFGRFDKITSNILESEELPWALAKDGSAVITGLQYAPIKGLRMALNYQDWYPYASNEENEAFIYLNFEIKL